MRKSLFMSIILSAFFAYSCASEGYNTQKGAAVGAIGGALVGQAIGRNTAGTLIGAGGGALAGALVGNAMDQDRTQRRLDEASRPVYATPPPPEEAPPGRWVEVPGSWVNGKWVPAHRTWVPVNPDGTGPETEANPPYPAPPPYAMQAPPEVVPVPGTYVYFVPGVNVDILFYHGSWYRAHGGRWFQARSYNGPWVHIGPRRVPRAIVTLPRDYRRVPPGFHPVPHGELERNWQRWEHERHWDAHR
jgi:hypothetical protein